eukprot:1487302-Rhodomonas_salina.1
MSYTTPHRRRGSRGCAQARGIICAEASPRADGSTRTRLLPTLRLVLPRHEHPLGTPAEHARC